MLNTLDEGDWKTLLQRIKAGKCTPFLGAGINHGVLPLGSDISCKWANENNYPLKDHDDLSRVAQYLSIIRPDPMAPKEEFLDRWFNKVKPPNFEVPDEPLRVLAELPLSVYMTTNYDNFMVEALKNRNKHPMRELCRWNNHLNVKKRESVWDKNPGFRPSWTDPVVFHLHGLDEVPESLVLTEDDYVDFLVNIWKQYDLLPPCIQEALTGSSLLFIGYRLADWTFRVIFRGLISSMEPGLRRFNIAVQLPPNYYSWDGIQGSDNGKFVEFLKQNFSIDWVKSAKIKEIDDGKTIKIFNEKNYLLLNLNDDKTKATKATLKIDGDEVYEFIVKTENCKLNIYPPNTNEQQYLDNYFKNMNVRVYWGTAKEFSSELRRRWEAFPK